MAGAQELRPDRLQHYLERIAEAIIIDSNNLGSLRKAIWNYTYEKFKDQMHYYEFLIAIRRLVSDGKLGNQSGFYTVQPQVLAEIQLAKSIKNTRNYEEEGNTSLKSLEKII